MPRLVAGKSRSASTARLGRTRISGLPTDGGVQIFVAGHVARDVGDAQGQRVEDAEVLAGDFELDGGVLAADEGGHAER